MIIQSLTSIIILSLLWKPGSSVSQDEETLEKGLYGLTSNFGSLMFKTFPNQNVFFSPLSIYTNMAMLYKGASGSAKDELAKLLGLPIDSAASEDTIHAVLGKQLKSLQASLDANVSVANGLFLRDDLKLDTDFQQQMTNIYDAQVTSLDFTNKSSTEFINQYISDKTKGRIPKVFNDKLEDSTAVVCVNVLFSALQWKNRFSKYLTDTNATFTTTGDKKIQVALMSNTKTVGYLDNVDKKYRAISLPYTDHNFTMFYVLPYENESLTTLCENFKADDLQYLVNATLSNREYVNYRIPRTLLSWSSDLNEKLKELGVKTIFDKPDFSKMVNDVVYVSKVTHATDLKIDESGTVAAAVTVTTAQTRSGHTAPMINFEVTRPHMLIMYHQATKMVMFYGAIYNPPGN